MRLTRWRRSTSLLGSAVTTSLSSTDLLDRAAEYLAPLARDGRLLVVSDETVWTAVGGRLRASLGEIEAIPILVPAGEASKSWAGLQTVVDALLAQGVERSDHIVAFGGGVVGDLAGFAAAIVNRGCGFVQVPTSLLAQVDSSVGGKTAINVAAGKNLVGAFHQPSLVLIDPSLLDTLDPREVRAGYAEIVKYALIEDAELFGWLEDNGAKVLGGDPAARTHAIAAAVAGKARIVEEDERETSGRRALLNLGHTFGHALEAETGYSDRLLHGEAVALGCVLAFAFSAERGLCSTRGCRARAIAFSVGRSADFSRRAWAAGAGRASLRRTCSTTRSAPPGGPRSFSCAVLARRSSTSRSSSPTSRRSSIAPTDDLRRSHRRPDRPIEIAGDPQILARPAGPRRRLSCGPGFRPTSSPNFLDRRRSDADWRGCNVTIPHKQSVIPLLDRLDAGAEAIGAVNCVVPEDGALVGYNTDIDGIAAALDSTELRGRKAALIGAGGAARAVVAYLASRGVGRIALVVRNPERAEALRSLAPGVRHGHP